MTNNIALMGAICAIGFLAFYMFQDKPEHATVFTIIFAINVYVYIESLKMNKE